MRIRNVFAALVIAAAMAACSTAPIKNVSDGVVPSAAGQSVNNAQVRAAIVRAGVALGWQMKDEGPNLLVGTLQLRTHTAVVEIPYSTTQYSIKYRSSVGLDEKGGAIHKNYNGWIQNLTNGINAQVSAL